MNKQSSADVENYTHAKAKRRNIPTAENQVLVPDEEKAVKTLRYPRNPDLDPQLVWRGKDVENGRDLEVQAPPVYIQEKIHPRVLIEDLKRRTAKHSATQIDLFHDFNGLADPEARTEFYAHEQNWSNRMILGDSLLVMGSLAERERLRGQVQAIYFDPPYGIKFSSNWQPSTKSREVKETNVQGMSREPEVVRAFRDTWSEGKHSYLSYVRDSITTCRDLLSESGCIFVQIGLENMHRVRLILDEVFGDKNFVAQIMPRKTATPSLYIDDNTFYVLMYAKSIDRLKFRQLWVNKPLYDWVTETRGGSWGVTIGDLDRPLTPEERRDPRKVPPGGEVYALSKTNSAGASQSDQWFEFHGERFHPGRTNHWKTSLEGMRRLEKAGRLESRGGPPWFKKYHADNPNKRLTNAWDDTSGKSSERIYVVQTEESVVERCLLMATDPGDLVLDPTCGSGTTAFVAEQWGRRWITIDTSRVALALARARLMAAEYEYYLPRDSAQGAVKESELTGKPVPAPSADHTPDLRQGFVLRRAPRVTLKSIANNAEIDVIWDTWQKTLESLREQLNVALGESWDDWEIPRDTQANWSTAAKDAHAAWWNARRERQKEIDRSIARGAEVEFLYDRPYKAKDVVRVAGPFTVESLSPHRVLPLAEDPMILEAMGEDSDEPPFDEAREQTDFAQVVLEQLKAAGVQNTKKGEAIKFEWLKPFPSNKGYVAFEGVYLENGEERRAAVAVGPEYDTVGYDFVRGAAREASTLFDTLIICGFAFAPEVDDTRLSLGNLTVLKARMNQDLRMSDKLKATGAGNLFVIFGEPDIRVLDVSDGEIKVEIKGVDIFDPTTGDVKSSDDPSEDIACWFIDDDYDEESFFVRQAYFLGRDPYESLKRALKAEINEDAWAELNSTVSRPFAKPASGKICVKVINHFGDEVQKVFSV